MILIKTPGVRLSGVQIENFGHRRGNPSDDGIIDPGAFIYFDVVGPETLLMIERDGENLKIFGMKC